MNYAQIYECDVANGVGCRTSLFVSGCTHHCPECFNPQAWDFGYGKPFTKEVEDKIVESVGKGYVKGLSLLGGEPMEPANQRALISLIRRVKALGKTIWVYSGYTWEELTNPENRRCRSEVTDEILSTINVLVDGEFHIAEKDISLKFRGSRNQRVLDVKRTREEGRPVLADLD